MEINPNIFRAYDIRGNVDSDLSPEFAYLLGRAFAHFIKEKQYKKVALGWDCRKTSKTYADNLSDGLTDGGVDCLVLGMCPTPQLYWSLFNCDCDAGIQVTGSHNAINMNGFKLCIGKETIAKDDIKAIQKIMQDWQGKPPEKSTKPGIKEYLGCHDDYVRDLIERCLPKMGSKKLRVVVDAGNGVAGLTGPDVLKGLGAEVIEMFCEPNGFFPNHHPDPSVPSNLDSLKKRVIEEKADFGIAWDGDGDRIAVVDEKGQALFTDLLLLIYAEEVLAEDAGATVVVDVKCSDKLTEIINKAGGKVVFWNSGHSLMKQKIAELKAAFGGEFSGHIFFNQRYYGFDDGAYCAARFLEILSNTEKSLSEIVSDYPTTFATAEIRIPCPDEIKFKIIEKLKEQLSSLPLMIIDGIRITFPAGWGLIRASNTEPALTIRAESNNEADLQRYRIFMEGCISEIREQF